MMASGEPSGTSAYAEASGESDTSPILTETFEAGKSSSADAGMLVIRLPKWSTCRTSPRIEAPSFRGSGRRNGASSGSRRSHLGRRYSHRQMPRHRGEDVAPVKRLAHRRGEVARLDQTAHLEQPQTLCRGVEQPVVRTHQAAALGHRNDRIARRPDAWVDHREVYRPGGKVFDGAPQVQRSDGDLLRRHLVAEVDQACLRGDAEDDPLHDTDVGITAAEVGEKRNQPSIRHLFTNPVGSLGNSSPARASRSDGLGATSQARGARCPFPSVFGCAKLMATSWACATLGDFEFYDGAHFRRFSACSRNSITSR